jgi:hypothetical protein
MHTGELSPSLRALLSELVDGAPRGNAFVLNPGDPGLLRSLDRIGASEASAVHAGGASIAAHVEHVRYGLSLMNRWAAGEPNPFAEADWSAAWKRVDVSSDEWEALRESLREECDRWLRALDEPREVASVELKGMIGSVAHLAYHLGAMRQMDRAIRGPAAND